MTALVREPARLAVRPGLTLLTGTPEREADIEKAFAGAVPPDGVVVALNNVRASDMPWARQISPPRFMADAVRYTTDAMKRHGVERIAVVSAMGVGDSPKTLHTTEVGLGVKPGLLISRRAVARFAVDAALGGGWAGRAPIIWEK